MKEPCRVVLKNLKKCRKDPYTMVLGDIKKKVITCTVDIHEIIIIKRDGLKFEVLQSQEKTQRVTD